MEAIFQSFLLVAATEMGDKTQLLALILATRFKKPKAVLAGIFVATVLNHLLATILGRWISQQIPARTLDWILGSAFIAFALWVLVPDKEGETKTRDKYGAFLTTTIAFFFAEMGDKTQLSTVALAARYESILMVTIGSTLGMMFSDGLAVYFGERLTQKISMTYLRWFAAALFVLFGLGIILR